MKPEEDAYGQQIWAHYNGRVSFEIVERDDGYFSISGGVKTYFSRYDEWSPEEKEALAQDNRERVSKGRIQFCF